MDLDFESEEGAHDAYREAEVAGRSHLYGVAAEELLHVVIRESLVIVVLCDHACLEREILCMLEDFVYPTSRLDRTGYGQMAVHLEEEASRDVCAVLSSQSVPHRSDLLKRRFDQAVVGLCLREALAYIRSESLESPCGIGYVLIGYHKLRNCIHHLKRQILVVDPERLLTVCNVPEDTAPVDEFLCVIPYSHITASFTQTLLYSNSPDSQRRKQKSGHQSPCMVMNSLTLLRTSSPPISATRPDSYSESTQFLMNMTTALCLSTILSPLSP